MVTDITPRVTINMKGYSKMFDMFKCILNMKCYLDVCQSLQYSN